MEDLDIVAVEEDPLGLNATLDENGEKVKKGLVHLDYNPCCGTHVKSLKDLQCIKILHQEKIRGDNCRLFFVCGQRALNLLQETYQVTRDLATVLSAPGGPETFVETVVKNQKQSRETFKQTKNLYKDLATYVVRDWVAELKEKNPILEGETKGPGYLITHHREDADMDYLILLTSLLKDQELVKGGRIFVLSAGDKKEGGPMIVIGQDEVLVKSVAAEIVKHVEVKGGGKGRWQGKSKSWKGLEDAHAAAEILVHSA